MRIRKPLSAKAEAAAKRRRAQKQQLVYKPSYPTTMHVYFEGEWLRRCNKCWRTLYKKDLSEPISCECGWLWA